MSLRFRYRADTRFICDSTNRKHPERNGAHAEMPLVQYVIARHVVEGCVPGGTSVVANLPNRSGRYDER